MLASTIKSLEKQHYKIIGKHSAVKVCHWTKKDLVDEDCCYKARFYNLRSYSCCQMTPSLICCNSCVYCWREINENTMGIKLRSRIDEPKEIIENCIKAQGKLLNGFPGNLKINMKKFKEAQNLKHFAISLSGEPMIYPYMSELIGELDKRKIISFLVTNGQFPKAIEKLDRMPTQLYISLDAPTKQIYRKIDRPMLKDYWERLNKSLELMPSLDTRTVIRITAIKGLNMCNEKDYAKLIEKANPMFVEVKGYMWVGRSRYKLINENMPLHSDVKEFAKKICDFSDLKLIDEKKESRVVLLMREDFKWRKLKFQ